MNICDCLSRYFSFNTSLAPEQEQFPRNETPAPPIPSSEQQTSETLHSQPSSAAPESHSAFSNLAAVIVDAAISAPQTPSSTSEETTSHLSPPSTIDEISIVSSHSGSATNSANVPISSPPPTPYASSSNASSEDISEKNLYDFDDQE